MLDTTRRAMLGGAGAVAVLMAAPAIAASAASPLRTVFEQWRCTLRAINDPATTEQQEAALWADLDAAEYAIINAADATPEVARFRLWLALEHMTTDRADGDATASGDLHHFLRTSAVRDWHVRLTINAIAALEGQAGAVAWPGGEA